MPDIRTIEVDIKAAAVLADNMLAVEKAREDRSPYQLAAALGILMGILLDEAPDDVSEAFASEAFKAGLAAAEDANDGPRSDCPCLNCKPAEAKA